jgi:hypothetical protein
MDWHFDIQHVGAQVRLLRRIDPKQNYVLAVVETDNLSWPAWRKARPDNGKLIREIVTKIAVGVPEDWLHMINRIAVDNRQREMKKLAVGTPEDPPHVTLAGHSGGGSFIFGYLNGGDAIPDYIDRIVWLDANYAYSDEERHGDKLLAWLKGDEKRHLIVFAYDDSQITLNGKPVLKTPMGGTFGSTHRMIDRISKEVKLTESKAGEFDQWIGMSGQIVVRIHPNPEKKILHTVLVERNGLIEAMTLGTPWEHKWSGEFWGPRAYSELVVPAPKHVTSAPSPARRPIGIPARPEKAIGGKAFAEKIAKVTREAREAAIVAEITRGNIPDFLRKFCKIRIEANGHPCTYEVMPDYLAVGSDDDFVRMPMTPASAETIADAFGCSLPTRKMVNDIYNQTEIKLEPRPMTEQREAVGTFVAHNAIIQEQLAGKRRGALVAGDKKDVVLSNRLNEQPHRVAIYGWHKLDGKPIQPLTIVHGNGYVDYSHGIRLVKREVLIDGKPQDIDEVLKDSSLCGLLSDEGPIDAGY